MRTKLVVIGALIALAQPGSAAAQGTLEGTVTHAETGNPLAGAQIAVSDLSMGGNSRTDGGYEITGIPAGTHTVQILLIGYQTATQQVTIADGMTTELDVSLSVGAVALEGLVAVGSRARPRTVTESPVPVDVIPTREIVNQGDTDFANLLRNVVPSFNVNTQPISDAATFARPANLRGLAPDHSLILVNGKRRHRTAVITWYGNGLADGSQGPDIAVIPGLALEQAEVLRDGAAAQYGSDAIAGVMNFVLKNDNSGGSLEFKTGNNLFEGDGEMYTLSGNVGLPLGESGFLNLTGEYGNAGATDRSVQRDDAIALVRAGNTSVREPAQIWGAPAISDEIKVWANMGYLFNDNVQFYSHGNYVSKQVEGGFYYRNPNTRSGVFATTNDAGEDILLVGDMLDASDGVLDGSAGCPDVRVEGGVVADQAAWNQVLGDPNCFTFQKLFPGGFTPQFGAYVLDASAVAGLKGASGDLSWDASASWGKSNMDFYMYNTVNASLGPNQPCSDKGTSSAVPDQSCTPYFNPGIYDQQETNLNVDLSYELNERVNLAGGGEWRNERFEIFEGSRGVVDRRPARHPGLHPGLQRFYRLWPTDQGRLEPQQLRRLRRHGDPRTGRCMDLRLCRAHRELLGLWNDDQRESCRTREPLRGIWTAGERQHRIPRSHARAAERIQHLDDLRSRSDGPDQQRHHSFNLGSCVGVRREVADTREVQELRHWCSVRSGPVQLFDRFVRHQRYGPSHDEQELQSQQRGRRTPAGRGHHPTRRCAQALPLLHQRLRHPPRPGSILVGAYEVPGGDGGSTTFSTAWNWTSTSVTQFKSETLSDLRIRILEEGLPNVRGNISVNRSFANGMRFLARVSHWGGYFDGETPFYEGSSSNTIDYPSRQLIDLEAAHTFMDNWTVTVGGQNALNTFPEAYPGAAGGVGNQYGQFTPFGFNGAFYYGRLTYRW